MSNGIIAAESGLPAGQSYQNQIIAMAADKDFDLDRLEKVIELQERWEKREAEKKFNAAMAQFKGSVKQIKKSKVVDFTNQKGMRTCYNYASLDDIEEATKGALKEAGLYYRWIIKQGEGKVYGQCVISHVDGHSITSEPMVGPYDASGGKNAIQAVASAQTYVQKYTLISTLGLCSADEDDDGNIAKQRDEPPNFQKVGQQYVKNARDHFTADFKRGLLRAIRDEDSQTVSDMFNGLTEEQQKAIWVAETKGGFLSQADKKFIGESNTKHA